MCIRTVRSYNIYASGTSRYIYTYQLITIVIIDTLLGSRVEGLINCRFWVVTLGSLIRSIVVINTLLRICSIFGFLYQTHKFSNLVAKVKVAVAKRIKLLVTDEPLHKVKDALRHKIKGYPF